MRVKFEKRDSYFGQRTLGLKYFSQQASVLHFAHLSLHKLPHTHLIESNCKFRHNKLEIGLSWSQILTWSHPDFRQNEKKFHLSGIALQMQMTLGTVNPEVKKEDTEGKRDERCLIIKLLFSLQFFPEWSLLPFLVIFTWRLSAILMKDHIRKEPKMASKL